MTAHVILDPSVYAREGRGREEGGGRYHHVTSPADLPSYYKYCEDGSAGQSYSTLRYHNMKVTTTIQYTVCNCKLIQSMFTLLN